MIVSREWGTRSTPVPDAQGRQVDPLLDVPALRPELPNSVGGHREHPRWERAVPLHLLLAPFVPLAPLWQPPCRLSSSTGAMRGQRRSALGADAVAEVAPRRP